MRSPHDGHMYVSRVHTGSVSMLHTGRRLRLTDFICVPLGQLHTAKVVPETQAKVNPPQSNALSGSEPPVRTTPCIPRILSWVIRHRACGRGNALSTPCWSPGASCCALWASLCLNSVSNLLVSTLRLVAGRHDVSNLSSRRRGERRWGGG